MAKCNTSVWNTHIIAVLTSIGRILPKLQGSLVLKVLITPILYYAGKKNQIEFQSLILSEMDNKDEKEQNVLCSKGTESGGMQLEGSWEQITMKLEVEEWDYRLLISPCFVRLCEWMTPIPAKYIPYKDGEGPYKG